MKKRKEKRELKIIYTDAKNPPYKEVAELIIKQAAKIDDEWFEEIEKAQLK